MTRVCNVCVVIIIDTRNIIFIIIIIMYSCSDAQLRATSCFVYQSYYMLINKVTKKGTVFNVCVNNYIILIQKSRDLKLPNNI